MAVRDYYFYIMSSFFGTLYAGVTDDLERRVYEHKSRLIPGFSARYNTTRLVYYEEYGDIQTAIAREKQVKGWLRAKKVTLIESMNPDWRDLSEDWLGSSLRSE